MSNDGQNILELFQQARRICEQVALLLRSQEAQMEKKAWKTDRSTGVSDLSYSIKYPTWWIPIVVFRLYKNENYPNKLAFASVLLDNHWDNEYSLTEPLVTAGFFDYGNEEVNGDWQYSFARIYGYLYKNQNWEANGEPFSFDRAMLSSSHKGNFKNGKVFALPLVSIKNDKEIKSKITNKLLTLVEKKE
ncbi:MAG: hypothetical protein ACW97P_06780 [Candidatus Hodarchaeales archaeon]